MNRPVAGTAHATTYWRTLRLPPAGAGRPSGQLVVTDDFLRSLLERPELAPGRRSPAPTNWRCTSGCWSSRARRWTRCSWPPSRDEDARANYAIWLRFRQRLLAQPTLEASYMALFQGEGVDVPPVFVHQLTQILLRHMLGGERRCHAGAGRRDAVSHPAHRGAGRRRR